MTAALVKDFERIPMSQALASTLARAAEYASAQAHVEVTLEHLLLALTEDEDAEVVFATSNVNVGQLKIDVSEQLGRIEERLPLDQNATARVSPAVRRILEASAQAAQGRRNEINGAIVLAAIVGDGNSIAANLLRIQGLTFEAAIRALQNSLTAPASTTQKPQPAPQQQTAPPQNIPRNPAPVGVPPVVGKSQSVANKPVAQQNDPATAEDFLARARAKVQSRTTTGRPSPKDTLAANEMVARQLEQDDSTSDVLSDKDTIPQNAGKSEAVTKTRAPDTTGTPSPRTGPPQAGSWAPPKPTQPPAPPQQPRPSRPPPPIPTNVANTAPPPQAPAPAPAPNTGTRPGLAPPPPPNAAPAAPPWPGPASARNPMPAQQPGNGGAYPPGTTDPHRRLPQHGRAPNSPAYGTQFEAAAPRPDIAQPRRPTIEAGQLVENIPRTMQVDVPAHAEISIAAAGITDLEGTLQGAGPAHRHDLMITKAMSVRLRAPDGGFFIETASPETQWIDQNLGIEADEYARWRWTVTPKTRGRKRLQAIISARTVGADGLAAETALPDQIIEVKIHANYAKNVKHIGGWTLAAIAGGIAARFGEQIWETSRTLIQSIMSGS